MYPMYEEGTHLFFKRADGVSPALFGKECIVQTTDGRTLVKELRRGTRDGLFTLLSRNAPPIEDVEVIWAARVLGTWNKI